MSILKNTCVHVQVPSSNIALGKLPFDPVGIGCATLSSYHFTPSSSASNISNTILLTKAILPVASSCSPNAVRAFSVAFRNRCWLQ